MKMQECFYGSVMEMQCYDKVIRLKSREDVFCEDLGSCKY